MTTTMEIKNREQYIEPLIKLIELNNDKYWIQYFLDLRKGHILPGGGAGSLNDWSPSYSNQIESGWYYPLYIILRQLFDNDLPAKEVYCNKWIKFSNNVRIIRCLGCNKSFQHPSIFEENIALTFYRKNFVDFAKSKQLLNLFHPEFTYKSIAVDEYRDWLKKEYEINDIKIYDFVKARYICPHCRKDHSETEHDLYVVKDDGVNKTFQKQNAEWKDFEREY